MDIAETLCAAAHWVMDALQPFKDSEIIVTLNCSVAPPGEFVRRVSRLSFLWWELGEERNV